MNDQPRKPRNPSRLLLFILCGIVAMVVLIFVGMNLSHYTKRDELHPGTAQSFT